MTRTISGVLVNGTIPGRHASLAGTHTGEHGVNMASANRKTGGSAAATLAGQVSQQSLPPDVLARLQEAWLRVTNFAAAARVWERLTDEQREQLGGTLPTAYERLGTVGMWMTLHNRWSQPRAIIELARELSLIAEADYRWLDRKVAAIDPIPAIQDDPEELIERARQQHRLVLVQGGGARRMYWNGEAIDARWEHRSTIWDLLWKLAQSAERRSAVGWDEVVGGRGPRTLTDRRSKLKGFVPDSFNALIEPDHSGGYRLKLQPSEIKLIELPAGEALMSGPEDI
jgi:hypothetical protein